MLVLSRQRGEVITIGDDIEITVVDIRGDKIRLGIAAPKKVPVHRKEVYDAIQRGEIPESASIRHKMNGATAGEAVDTKQNCAPGAPPRSLETHERPGPGQG